MTAAWETGSDVVVTVLARAGGQASRTTVLRAVAARRGRREAGHAIAMALLAGRCEQCLLSDGVLGLRLVERGENGEVAS